jgi:diketogulonate reductase-like aldo/keto reductase
MSCAAGGDSFTLNSGHAIPAVGLGVYQAAHGDEAYEACLNALKMGYRHIDTAQIYRNEGSVGRAIKDSGISRDKIFVTTKFWCQGGHGRKNAVDKLKESLSLLMLTYVDLYLMHSPGSPGAAMFRTTLGFIITVSPGDERADSWKGMEGLKMLLFAIQCRIFVISFSDCVAQGLARSIGVSNYGVSHLKASSHFHSQLP